jgi:hypothetical protein
MQFCTALNWNLRPAKRLKSLSNILHKPTLDQKTNAVMPFLQLALDMGLEDFLKG